MSFMEIYVHNSNKIYSFIFFSPHPSDGITVKLHLGHRERLDGRGLI